MGGGSDDWEELFVEEHFASGAVPEPQTCGPLNGLVDSENYAGFVPASPSAGSCRPEHVSEDRREDRRVEKEQGSEVSEPKDPDESHAADVMMTSWTQDLLESGTIDKFHECASSLFLKELTFVLVGKSGNGKSATGNMLLGRDAFKATSSPGSVTKQCQKESATLPSGMKLNIIDTPGLFDTSATEEEIQAEIIECSTLAPEGIHGMLVVLTAASRFTTEEAEAISRLKKMFGPRLLEFGVLVFTHGDQLLDELSDDEEHVEDNAPPSVQLEMLKADQALSSFLSGAPPNLQQVLLEVHSRMLLFDNTVVKKRSRNDEKQRAQVDALVQIAEQLIREHDGQIYSEILIEEMTRAAELETQRLLDQKRLASQEAEQQQMEYARKLQAQLQAEEQGMDDGGLVEDLRLMEARLGARVESRVKTLEEEMKERFDRERADLQRDVERAQQKAEEAQARVDLMREQLRQVQEESERRRWWNQVPGCMIM